MQMRRDHTQFLAELLLERAGQVLAPDRLFLIESRLSPLARREGFASVPALIESLRQGSEPRLLQSAAEALVDPETSFFRDRAPFQQFRDLILPAMARARAGQPVRVWSAGAGTGQEAYSLAMIADQAEARTDGLTVELTATDFSDAALEKAPDSAALILPKGGPGLAPRAIPPAATRASIEREVPGIPEVMRAVCVQKTPFDL